MTKQQHFSSNQHDIWRKTANQRINLSYSTLNMMDISRWWTLWRWQIKMSNKSGKREHIITFRNTHM